MGLHFAYKRLTAALVGKYVVTVILVLTYARVKMRFFAEGINELIGWKKRK